MRVIRDYHFFTTLTLLPFDWFLIELAEFRSPRGHEAILGRDEEAVQQDENADGDELEEEAHGPTPRPLVLGGSSSSN